MVELPSVLGPFNVINSLLLSPDKEMCNTLTTVAFEKDQRTGRK